MNSLEESVTKAMGTTKATSVAWVCGDGIVNYRLCINKKNAATQHFHSLHLRWFDNYRAAKAIANAIRAHVAGGAK